MKFYLNSNLGGFQPTEITQTTTTSSDNLENVLAFVIPPSAKTLKIKHTNKNAFNAKRAYIIDTENTSNKNLIYNYNNCYDGSDHESDAITLSLTNYSVLLFKNDYNTDWGTGELTVTVTYTY